MPLIAIALASALSALPDIGWERERAEDAHQLMLCQIHRDQLADRGEKSQTYQQAKAVCDLLAREYKQNWDFDAHDALAAEAVDFFDLLQRGEATAVPPRKSDHALE
ncbi:MULTISPECIES: hypothetical protein [Stenotrophomonas]|jgi:hypothetical protein|uniref:Uncharacterized protein n=1 Tax=Stenotrophomonas indicatrix TaxID=2045451 RepID=A0A1W1H029_9GAMM|nr:MULTISPECIES: hypothetical protein [Stenotrophomonas]PJL08476.1 hypothetical protein B9Y68_16725 [Stenotrophomonas maltophilia]AVJ34679.1 hypothetical protein CLM74_18715 [Stenotrophomonas sp. MYb57]EZP44758.1 hypothetical protein BW38_02534 [Stenotrophomonas sp. RIT309]MDR6695807.1 hypothetical protein [Stenotrophomonas sp. 1337]PII13218.1 hypothetical protein CR918_16495 [Stenotrophomonas indicatrix]|eukprot:TRINITY_DN14264_c0_g1_i2.p3 TRINITY_DN14264_c0_g1~~TRINITY_DN14264_c0_g1_i2.p3  ORF type:complete len:107 (-),score=31.12 TRINITY_DN14264_c0_g1_i2:266-586(-)